MMERASRETAAHGCLPRRSARWMQPFSVGVDRTKAIAGPDRVVTDASLLRKDFSIGGGIRSARLTVTALGAYRG